MATKKRKRKVSRLGGSQDFHAKDLHAALALQRQYTVAASKASTCKVVIDRLLDAAFAQGRIATNLSSLKPAVRRRWWTETSSVTSELAAITKAARIKCRVY